MTSRGFVIVGMGGQLGNQMFQYAAAKAVAVRTSQPLFLAREPGPNADLLDGLRIDSPGDVTPTLALRAGLAPWKSRRGSRLLRALVDGRGVRWFTADVFGKFYPEVLELSGPTVLLGQFQSERYFMDVAALVRQEFRPKRELGLESSKLVDRLRKTPSVGVQVRRGDYLGFGPMEDRTDDGFYVRAVEEIARRLGERPLVYGFSDDSRWLHQGFREWFPQGVPVSGSVTRDHYEDLAVLAACSHQVISPSTFGWWGAWLNENPGKIVIAPRRWPYNWAAPDVVPDAWIRM